MNIKRTILVLAMMAAAMAVGLRYGCLFRNVFGIECPSCGISRAWLALLKGDLRAAIGYNPLFWLPPALILYCCRDGWLVSKRADLSAVGILLAVYFAAYLFRVLA